MTSEWDINRVNAQADAWASLAGAWESELTIEDEIEALYAMRTLGREVAW
ncbi:hypothetical protein SAMN02745166_03592 [Prosthecobacter debontii]|uniref:Uncharacterized protein n=1 Tax=Prosthecobacter debontii TaxID=48467 RepID=A0A1T4YLU2_9BACT|nr:hypothetical protein [Prosthecobacter debontii]SKB02241.1 hypothetical protein SAMN02745166_03592 [Prosthecobacter debontii]